MSSDPLTHRASISLGSNISPEQNLPAAVRELSHLGTLSAVSYAYESAAVGDTRQPNYLNACVLLITEYSAEDLCRTFLPTIESKLGRVRDPANKFAARTIDLDLVLFDDEVRVIGHRRIPDPDIVRQPYLAVPLAEIHADRLHPETGEKFTEIAARVRGQSPALQRRSDVDLESAAKP